MSERKMNILRFIIQEYIETAEPVGSRTISKNPTLDVSAATIRNEMADLEDMGLLIQPHTSAGRVPSVDAYRLYVDKMMQKSSLAKKEIAKLERHFMQNMDHIQSLLEDTAEIISTLTNYTTVSIPPKKKQLQKILQLQFTYLNDHKAVMIIILEDGHVVHRVIEHDVAVTEDKLVIIGQAIEEYLRGKTIESFDDQLINYVQTQISTYSNSLDHFFTSLSEKINDNHPFNIIFNGTTNIFNYPEFNDLERARSLFHFFEKKEELPDIFINNGIHKGNINIIIGSEDMNHVMSSCSLVMAEFDRNGKQLGKVGIIGPKRMDYDRAYAIMNYVTKKLNHFYNESP